MVRDVLRILPVAICLILLAGVGQAANNPLLFGTQETFSVKLALFGKWTGSRARFEGELRDCQPEQCDKQRWQRFLDGLAASDTRSKIEAVNAEMNRHPYIVDPANWGVPDYWETPFEFLRRDGDCEDYAISKYMALRALGLDPSALRIVVLQDLNLDLGHAVLAVYLDSRILILDNQIKRVVDADSIRHYRPIYSINETGWWLHQP
jgi:predicted transglutaminase-like cysteine proteinase